MQKRFTWYCEYGIILVVVFATSPTAARFSFTVRFNSKFVKCHNVISYYSFSVMLHYLVNYLTSFSLAVANGRGFCTTEYAGILQVTAVKAASGRLLQYGSLPWQHRTLDIISSSSSSNSTTQSHWVMHVQTIAWQLITWKHHALCPSARCNRSLLVCACRWSRIKKRRSARRHTGLGDGDLPITLREETANSGWSSVAGGHRGGDYAENAWTLADREKLSATDRMDAARRMLHAIEWRTGLASRYVVS